MNGNLFPQPAISNEWVTAHCDGGSRGNPGPSGYGAVIEDPQGHVLAELSEYLGIQTNNFAEYSGLLGVLKWAVHNNVHRLRVISDSELMVKQMKGQYKVASPILRPLWEEAKRLSHRVEAFDIRHTLRGGNKVADQLANNAMDRGMGKAPSTASNLDSERRNATPPTSRTAPPPAAKSAVPLVNRSTYHRIGEAEIRPPAPPAVGPATSPAATRTARPAPVRPVNHFPPPPAEKQALAASAPPRAAAHPAEQAAPARNVPTAKPERRIFEGYVQGGVVHLLNGDGLPDGLFVRVVCEEPGTATS